MPKKLTIISTLMLLTSSLGSLVPAFADREYIDTYSASEVIELRPEYDAAMSECDEYDVGNNIYGRCYVNVDTEFLAKYGSKFSALQEINARDKIVVTAINPSAGTIRIYADETNGYRMPFFFTLKNLVIFWADNNNGTNLYNDSAIWGVADKVINGGLLPNGIHVLYHSEQGQDNWLTPNAEYKTTFNLEDANFATDYKNPHPYFFVVGYDTDGERHYSKNFFQGCRGGVAEDEECQLQLYWTGESVARAYAGASATPEDLAIIEERKLKAALEEAQKTAEEAANAAADAKQRAAEAEERAIAAETRAAEAEIRATEAEAVAKAAQTAARTAQQTANTAKNAAATAEANAREARAAAETAKVAAEAAKATANAAAEDALAANARAAEAENRAIEAESRASEAEMRAREAESRATSAEKAAIEAENRAKEAEEQARATALAAENAVQEAERIATETAENIAEANKIAEETAKAAAEANKIAEEAAKTAEETANLVKELSEKLANLSDLIGSISPSITNQTTSITNNYNTYSTTRLEAATSALGKALELSTDLEIPILETNESSKKSNDTTNGAGAEDYVELPLSGDKTVTDEKPFPWWIVAFGFSGIALVLWWFIPFKFKKSQKSSKN